MLSIQPNKDHIQVWSTYVLGILCCRLLTLYCPTPLLLKLYYVGFQMTARKQERDSVTRVDWKGKMSYTCNSNGYIPCHVPHVRCYYRGATITLTSFVTWYSHDFTPMVFLCVLDKSTQISPISETSLSRI